jgi:hypothetical protein
MAHDTIRVGENRQKEGRKVPATGPAKCISRGEKRIIIFFIHLCQPCSNNSAPNRSFIFSVWLAG